MWLLYDTKKLLKIISQDFFKKRFTNFLFNFYRVDSFYRNFQLQLCTKNY